MALNIPLTIDKVRQRGFRHRVYSCGISVRVLPIIKFYCLVGLIRSSLKPVFWGTWDQCWRLPGSLSDPDLFLFYINDLRKKILRSSVNIYAGDSNIWTISAPQLISPLIWHLQFKLQPCSNLGESSNPQKVSFLWMITVDLTPDQEDVYFLPLQEILEEWSVPWVPSENA